MKRKPHRTMTQAEYAAMEIDGWHEVCRNVDGFGGVGVRFVAAVATNKVARGSRIDPEWKLTPDMGNYGRSRGLHRREVEQEAEKFRNYWTAKPGAAGVKLDWPATWRNWCISAAERLGRVPPQDPNTPPAVAELYRQTWENLAKIYEAQSNWRLDWGPEPGSPGCRMPADLQAKFVEMRH